MLDLKGADEVGQRLCGCVENRGQGGEAAEAVGNEGGLGSGKVGAESSQGLREGGNVSVEVGWVCRGVGDSSETEGGRAQRRGEKGRQSWEEGFDIGQGRVGKEKLKGGLRERRRVGVQQRRENEEEVNEGLGEARLLLLHGWL